MIKELINDLAYDKISISQGLTRAKLIAYKINDSSFKTWVYEELNGYSNDENLPDYRYLPCDLVGNAEIPFRGTREIIIDATALDEKLNGKIYNVSIYQSISTIESLVPKKEGEFNYLGLHQKLVKDLREMTGSPNLIEAYRRVHYTQLNSIVNNTKQKLIDTLLELNDNFPNLEDDFKPTPEQKEKVSTIINTNIYGGKVNSNVGVGDEIVQNQDFKDNSVSKEQKLEEIKELGVDEELIEEARKIINKNEEKSSISKSLMSWVGKVASKTAAINMPKLIEKVQDLF